MRQILRERTSITAERWATLEPLLDAALDLLVSERDAFLQHACASDPTLLMQLQGLLATSTDCDDELEMGAGALASDLLQGDVGDTPAVSAVLAGRFRIEREIGRGGMSTVYLATDLQLRRRVAIKVLRMDLRNDLAEERFASEIQLTARLRHPNIVPLFDCAEQDGLKFFVMPFLEGETLQQRISRDAAIETREIVAICSDVARALQYAHDTGVVHRDIKPSNILIVDGVAMLVDFGIARHSEADAGILTATGYVVGTPAYMSPEQCTGRSVVGPQSDIYSLGCVMHELLWRAKPLSARARVEIAENGTPPARALSSQGYTGPAQLDAVTDRAMQLDPAARFASAQEFHDAIVAASESGLAPPQRVGSGRRMPWGRSRRWVVPLGGAVIAICAIGASMRSRSEPRSASASRASTVGSLAADSSHYALLPYEGDAAVVSRYARFDPLRPALQRWAGIVIVDAEQTADALAAVSPREAAHVSGVTAAAVAHSLGAGRYVRRDVELRSGRVNLRARSYEAQSGRMLSDATIVFDEGDNVSGAAFEELADELLYPTVPKSLRTGLAVGTLSRPALQAFAHGVRAVDEWHLAAADSALRASTFFDPAFARAELLLAQVRVWQRKPREAWAYLVGRTAARRHLLTTRDTHVLDALLADVAGDAPRSCALWERFATTEGTDFSAWYGAANCQRSDNAVVRDVHSPSGWRFRSSYHTASRSLLHAFQILPAVHREFSRDWSTALDGLLKSSPTQLRCGLAVPPDTGLFCAYPSWNARADTLEFIPFREQDFVAGQPWTYPTSHRIAIERQRRLMLSMAMTWRAAYTRSADALLSVGVALDKLGDATAIDSLAVAATLATTNDERLRIGMARVWITVKNGLPHDVLGLQSARRMSDSIIAANPVSPPEFASGMASLAMLGGHVYRSAEIVRLDNDAVDRVATASSRSMAAALLVFTAAGGLVDSVSALEQAIDREIMRSVNVDQQRAARERLLGRSATLAFPAYRSFLIDSFARWGDGLAISQAAWSRRDTVATLGKLQAMAVGRGTVALDGLKLETLLPEALLLHAIGDARGALERIGPALDAQPSSELSVLQSAVGIGVLIRSIGLRAVLEEARGDRSSARRWARAFTALWSGADPSQRSTVERMTQLSR